MMSSSLLLLSDNFDSFFLVSFLLDDFDFSDLFFSIEVEATVFSAEV
jgi:hypothetical protein